MRASDLMIGDYVTVTPSGMLIQVAATHKRKVAYHACTDKLSWVREGLLRPITLTTEILEKNGFTKESRIGNGKPLQYCVLVDGLWIDISGENYFEGNLEYVHQLQHALKLCKIEKEIVL